MLTFVPSLTHWILVRQDMSDSIGVFFTLLFFNDVLHKFEDNFELFIFLKFTWVFSCRFKCDRGDSLLLRADNFLALHRRMSQEMLWQKLCMLNYSTFLSRLVIL